MEKTKKTKIEKIMWSKLQRPEGIKKNGKCRKEVRNKIEFRRNGLKKRKVNLLLPERVQ